MEQLYICKATVTDKKGAVKRVHPEPINSHACLLCWIAKDIDGIIKKGKGNAAGRPYCTSKNSIKLPMESLL